MDYFNRFRYFTIFFNLVQSDFKRRYLGTYFGVFWAFAAPLATIGVLLFVFNVGFRSGPINGVRFDLWLVPGLIVWFYISDAVISGCNSIVEYSFLVKKIQFSTELLPIVKVCSSLYVHLVSVILLFGLYIYQGQYPSFFWFQILYYLLALIVFVLAISMIGSVVQVFFRDFQGVIAILMQIGLWGTPVLWDAKILPDRLAPLIYLNPASYIVQGYRDSLIFDIWFYQRPNQTIYFWTITLILLGAGFFLFNRSKRDFADVL
ncbi:ABC transporter permease [Rhodoferax sp. BLA1]|uniref:ABC transporter permease n=1 Tax=Rhodoferax sp. BLA1 TaxID=2576062 RepID=UPI0015D0EEB2|nr:ABC transporter permease [Rhodoferax sp. BLA1]